LARTSASTGADGLFPSGARTGFESTVLFIRLRIASNRFLMSVEWLGMYLNLGSSMDFIHARLGNFKQLWLKRMIEGHDGVPDFASEQQN
jgi:hypothetical protein